MEAPLDAAGLEKLIASLKTKNNEEFKIHCAIIDHIKEKRAFTAFVCHIYQGRNKEDGFFLKMLGVFAGVADIMVMWRSTCSCGKPHTGIGFLEVKRPKGIQTHPQKRFEGICRWLGARYAIVRSVKDAHEALLAWGCPVNHHAIKEPDTRSTEQKKIDAFRFFAP